MKSIVIGLIKTKQYYMGLSPIWLHEEMAYNSNHGHPGYLCYKYSDIEELTLCESNDFHKVLSIGETIQIHDKEYDIKKVKHGADGTMYYYVEVEQEDEESKSEAQKEIEKREVFLEGRKQMKENIMKQREDEVSKHKESIIKIDGPIAQKKSFLSKFFS